MGGYRSPLALWLGGASGPGGGVVPTPAPSQFSGGYGMARFPISRIEREKKEKEERAAARRKRLLREDEEILLLL